MILCNKRQGSSFSVKKEYKSFPVNEGEPSRYRDSVSPLVKSDSFPLRKFSSVSKQLQSHAVSEKWQYLEG